MHSSSASFITPHRLAILHILQRHYPNLVSEEDLIAEMLQRFPTITEGAIRKEMMPSSTFLRTQGYVIVHEIADGATFEAKITSIGTNLLAELESQRRSRIERKAETARRDFLTYSHKIPTSLVSVIKDKEAIFCLFLGAGVAKSAGLPLGNEMREIILKRIYGESDFELMFRKEFSAQIPKDQEITLEMVVQALRERFGNKAYDLLSNLVNDNKTPSDGYWSLMNLVHAGFFKIVITTNFDEVMENALDDGIGRSNYLRICSSDEFKSFTPEKNVDKPWLIKLHGTYRLPSTMVASWDDIQKLPQVKAHFLNYYSLYTIIIFIGYSGRDPDIREILQGASYSKKMKIFWVSPDALNKEALEILEWFDSEKNHITMTSDDFFGELEERLIEVEPRLKNEVSATILRLGANDEDAAVNAFQIAAGILEHPIWGPVAKEHYRGSFGRLVRDVAASCEAVLKEGHLDGYVGDGMSRRYWD